MTFSTESEQRIAHAAADLCEPDNDPETRFQISLATILATAVLTSVATCLILLVTWQWSFALLFAIWLWAALLASIFYFGQIPRLLGFGSVTGAFEISRHRFLEGPLTRLVKTMRFRPKND
jgi:uncharacterized protein (DUF58 family)